MDAFDPFASDNDDEPGHVEQDFFSPNRKSTMHRIGESDRDDSSREDHYHEEPMSFDGGGGDHDVFGQPLADVDLWEEVDENPFARPEVQDNLGFRGTSSDRPDSLKSPEGKKSGSSSSTRSKSRGKEGERNSPSKSSSSSKRAFSSASLKESPGILVPELTSFMSTSEDTRNKSRHSHGRSKSSSSTPPDKGSVGGDKIGELMELLKRENTERTTEGSSSRKDRSSRSGTSDRSGGSLRQKLMKDSSELDSPSRRRTPSSVVSESASGRKSSNSKREGSRSSQASTHSWDEHASSEHRHRRSGSRRSGTRSSNKNNEGDEGGLDLFMKGTHGRSSRGDTEHRSVVSAPAATASTEEISKLCQKMNLNF